MFPRQNSTVSGTYLYSSCDKVNIPLERCHYYQRITLQLGVPGIQCLWNRLHGIYSSRCFTEASLVSVLPAGKCGNTVSIAFLFLYFHTWNIASQPSSFIWFYSHPLIQFLMFKCALTTHSARRIS